jgi:choline dehydrogenase-like flavoprotein
MVGQHRPDVVIVGGGAAGFVLARRLAEAGERSVLLLEAGPDPRAYHCEARGGIEVKPKGRMETSQLLSRREAPVAARA